MLTPWKESYDQPSQRVKKQRLTEKTNESKILIKMMLSESLGKLIGTSA